MPGLNTCRCQISRIYQQNCFKADQHRRPTRDGNAKVAKNPLKIPLLHFSKPLADNIQSRLDKNDNIRVDTARAVDCDLVTGFAGRKQSAKPLIFAKKSYQ